MRVTEDDGVSKSAISHGFKGSHAFEINVALPEDPRCE